MSKLPPNGANKVERVREHANSTQPTPFNGLPIIYVAVGYMAIIVVILFTIALIGDGSIWVRLVLFGLVCAGGAWLLKRLLSKPD